jgi:hypothetical protein
MVNFVEILKTEKEKHSWEVWLRNGARRWLNTNTKNNWTGIVTRRRNNFFSCVEAGSIFSSSF